MSPFYVIVVAMDKRTSLRIRVHPSFKGKITRAAKLSEYSVNKFVNRILRKEVDRILAETQYFVDLGHGTSFTGYVIASQLNGRTVKIEHLGLLPEGSSEEAAISLLIKKFNLPNLQKMENE